MSTNKKCFVIFPFNEPYESRYKNIYEPALQNAGLKVMRAGGPGVGIITKDIEKKIKESLICFADLTEDNPNVWYEIGYAYACNKKVVMVCNINERSLDELPFDIRGRNIIDYLTITDKDDNARLELSKKISKDAIIKMEKAQKAISAKKSIPVTPQISVSSKNPLDEIVRGNLTKNEINVLKKIIDYRIVHNHKWDLGISNHVLLQKVTSKVQFHETISKLSDKRYIEKRNALGNIDSSSEESFTITPTEKAMKFAKENNDLF